MVDICCIGHITQDRVVNAQSVLHQPGGTAWYFSYALSRIPVNYLLITALAPTEMHYADTLKDKGIAIKVHPSAHTVYFENVYEADQDKRMQRVLATADAFDAGMFDGVNARYFHLGPLLPDDIPADVIKALTVKGRISLDVQGYLRKVTNKQVHAAHWFQKLELLPYVDILKADIAELTALTQTSGVEQGAATLLDLGVKEVIITNGSRGSQIFCDEQVYDIPAFMPHNVIDATGCGDTYMAGYLYKRAKGTGITEAGVFAAGMAGLKTTKAGAFGGTEADIMAFIKSADCT